MTQQENHANADKLSIQKIIFFVNDSVSIRQEATFCVERWRERNVFCTERESFGFSGKCFTGRRCSLLTDKREPERTAVPGGHESPSGAFKPQTGLRSKCRVFSAARSQRFRCAGPDGLRHPASASCLGRHSHPAGRCPNSSSLYPPLAAVVAVANKGLLALDNPKAEVETKKCQPLRSTHFFSLLRFAGPSVAARQLPTGRDKREYKNNFSTDYGQSARGGHFK